MDMSLGVEVCDRIDGILRGGKYMQGIFGIVLIFLIYCDIMERTFDCIVYIS